MKRIKKIYKNNEHEVKDLDILLLIPIVLILFFIAMADASAQESTLKMPVTNESTLSISEELAAQAEDKFQFPVSIDRSSNMQKESSPDRDDSTSLIFEPAYKFSEKSGLATRIDLILSDETDYSAKFSNAVIVYTPTTIDLSSEIKFKPNLSVTLPTDDQVRDEQSYRGGISVRPTFEYEVSQVKGLTLADIVYITKSFHEYEVSREYEPNSEFAVRNRFVVAYAITEKLSFEGLFDFVKAWTYNGYSKENFYFAQELRYEFIKDWSGYVGHKNEGSTRGANNHGENVDAYSSKTSYVSMGFTHVF